MRTEVFVQEQKIPESLEWDDKDPHAIHALAIDGVGKPAGTTGLLLHDEEAPIGRVAVLPTCRRKGMGGALLQSLVKEAKHKGARTIFLHGQIQALAFYDQFGFVREGEEFMEDKIPHIRMTLVVRD